MPVPASSGLLLGLCEVGAPFSLRLPSILAPWCGTSLSPCFFLLRCRGRRLVCTRDNRSEAPDWLAPGYQSALLLKWFFPSVNLSPVFFPGTLSVLLLESGLANGGFWFMDLWTSTMAVPAASASVCLWRRPPGFSLSSFLLDRLWVTRFRASLSCHHPLQQVCSSCDLFHLLWCWARPNAAAFGTTWLSGPFGNPVDLFPGGL